MTGDEFKFYFDKKNAERNCSGKIHTVIVHSFDVFEKTKLQEQGRGNEQARTLWTGQSVLYLDDGGE